MNKEIEARGPIVLIQKVDGCASFDTSYNSILEMAGRRVLQRMTDGVAVDIAPFGCEALWL